MRWCRGGCFSVEISQIIFFSNTYKLLRAFVEDHKDIGMLKVVETFKYIIYNFGLIIL